MADLKSVQEILNAVLSANGTQLAVSGAGGGGGGISNLSAASDVVVTGVAANDVLTYYNSKWTAGNTALVPSLAGLYFKRVLASSLVAGTNVVYTCPAGKKALCMTNDSHFYNPTAATVSAKMMFSKNGSYWKTAHYAAVAASAGTGLAYTIQHILSAGEEMALSCGDAGGNFHTRICEFDDEVPFFSTLTTDLISGQYNTLLTCSTGQQIAVIGNAFGFINSENFRVYNVTSATTNYFAHVVPDSLSGNTSNRISKSAATADQFQTGDSVILLSAGDRFQIFPDTARSVSASYVHFSYYIRNS